MTIINFKSLIQTNTKEELAQGKADLEQVIATQGDSYERQQQLKQFDIAIAWEAPTEHQLEQVRLRDLENAKRAMKHIKLESIAMI